jgi:hypothetical protein
MTAPKPVYGEEEINSGCLMVGKFFFHWAILESAMNDVICGLFSLATLEASIITANIKFTDKLYIIHTALQWQGRSHSEDWRKKARKLIGRIGRLNRSRNLLAHNLFGPLSNGSIRFHKVEAKGQFGYPTIHWSPKDFERTNKLIMAAGNELEQLATQIVDRRAIIKALSSPAAPMGGILGLASLPPPPLPAQFRLDNLGGSAIEQSNPQTHPSPEPKSEN